MSDRVLPQHLRFHTGTNEAAQRHILWWRNVTFVFVEVHDRTSVYLVQSRALYLPVAYIHRSVPQPRARRPPVGLLHGAGALESATCALE